MGSRWGLWLTELGAHGVVSVSPTGQPITGFPLPGSQGDPRGIVAGPDGNLWAVDTTGGNLDRITTSGVVNVYPMVGAGASPLLLAAGPDGSLWVTVPGNHAIVRFTL